MILRFLLSFCFILLLSPVGTTHAAEGIEVIQASLETTEEGYRLKSEFSLELTPTLEDALIRGVPLYFTTQVEISRPRWYWFDEKAITASRSIRISYNVLTKQYRVSNDGSLHRNFVKWEDVMALLRRPSRWVIAENGALKRGEMYTVALRMALDTSQLPKPIQISIIGGGDWQLSSDWSRFSFKAEGK